MATVRPNQWIWFAAPTPQRIRAEGTSKRNMADGHRRDSASITPLFRLASLTVNQSLGFPVVNPLQSSISRDARPRIWTPKMPMKGVFLPNNGANHRRNVCQADNRWTEIVGCAREDDRCRGVQNVVIDKGDAVGEAAVEQDN